MSSAIVTIRGGDIGGKVERPFCSFNGFMVQLFVAQSMFPHAVTRFHFLIPFHSRLLGSHHRRVHLPDPRKPQTPIQLGPRPQTHHLAHPLAPLHPLGNHRTRRRRLRRHRRMVLVRLGHRPPLGQLHPPLAHHHHHPIPLHQALLHHLQIPQPLRVVRRRRPRGELTDFLVGRPNPPKAPIHRFPINC